MGTSLEIPIMVISGILLFWFGHFLLFGPLSPFYPFMPWNKNKILRGKPGDSQVCPICYMKLFKGELLKIVALPSSMYKSDRLMQIKGCHSCLENNLPRMCPICKTKLSLDDYLISRLFERHYQRNNIHILGCNHCKKKYC
jgi:hypothetical protein